MWRHVVAATALLAVMAAGQNRIRYEGAPLAEGTALQLPTGSQQSQQSQEPQVDGLAALRPQQQPRQFFVFKRVVRRQRIRQRQTLAFTLDALQQQQQSLPQTDTELPAVSIRPIILAVLAGQQQQHTQTQVLMAPAVQQSLPPQTPPVFVAAGPPQAAAQGFLPQQAAACPTTLSLVSTDLLTLRLISAPASCIASHLPSATGPRQSPGQPLPPVLVPPL